MRQIFALSAIALAIAACSQPASEQDVAPEAAPAPAPMK